MVKYLVFGGEIRGQGSPYYYADWWELAEGELKNLVEKSGFEFVDDKFYYEDLDMEIDSFGNRNYYGRWINIIVYDNELDEIIENYYNGFISNYIKQFEGWG